MNKRRDKLRDQEAPAVLGYELDRDTLTPIRKPVGLAKAGDYGADPLGDGTFRMVPSGDVVGQQEKEQRLRNSPTRAEGDAR